MRPKPDAMRARLKPQKLQSLNILAKNRDLSSTKVSYRSVGLTGIAGLHEPGTVVQAGQSLFADD